MMGLGLWKTEGGLSKPALTQKQTNLIEMESFQQPIRISSSLFGPPRTISDYRRQKVISCEVYAEQKNEI